MRERLLLLLLVPVFAALWPSWSWLARRAADGDGVAWGLVPAAVLVASLATPRARSKRSWLPLGALLLVGYALTAGALPPLPRAFLGLTALLVVATSTVAERRPTVVELGLVALALPSLSSLQFFAGYPLRVACAELARWLLALQGLDVAREGVALVHGPLRVLVDAPCSGVRMLWAGALLVAVLATSLRLDGRALALLSAGAMALVVVGNALRACSLFLLELSALDGPGAPPWTHDGIGAATFALVATALVALALRLADGARRGAKNALGDVEPVSPRRSGALLVVAAAAISLGASAISPSRAPDVVEGNGAAIDPGTPGDWTPEPSTEDDERFRSLLSGRVARFVDGPRSLLVREVPRATRALHPSSDCLRADGWALGARSLAYDDEGALWGCFEGTRAERSARFCERVVDVRGRSFADLGAWYWEAALGRAEPPYRALTLVEPVR